MTRIIWYLVKLGNWVIFIFVIHFCDSCAVLWMKLMFDLFKILWISLFNCYFNSVTDKNSYSFFFRTSLSWWFRSYTWWRFGISQYRGRGWKRWGGMHTLNYSTLNWQSPYLYVITVFLLLLQISISNMQFDFRYGSNYSVYKVVILLLHFFLP